MVPDNEAILAVISKEVSKVRFSNYQDCEDEEGKRVFY